MHTDHLGGTTLLSSDQDKEQSVQVLTRGKKRCLDETLVDVAKFLHSTRLNRKNIRKQTTYRSPKRNEKQIDYIIIKRKHLKFNMMPRPAT